MTDRHSAELPEEVMKILRDVAERTGMEISKVVEIFYEKYNDPWVQTDPHFKDDMDRMIYAAKRTYVELLSAPPTKEFYVIPFGFTGKRVSKSSGIVMSRIYVVAKSPEGEWEKRVIVCRGAQADLIDTLQLFSAYKVRLAERGRILFATQSTRFENPTPLSSDPVKFLTKVVRAEPITVVDTPYKLSRKVDNFVDEFDLKMIRGFIISYNKGKRPDGTDWAVYTISDDSIGRVESEVTPDGKIIPKQLTVWVPPQQLIFDVGSEVIVVGTVQLNSSGEPFMNAICVVGIHPKPLVLPESG